MTKADPQTQHIIGTIRHTMRAAKITAKQLSDTTGISTTTLYRRLRGRTPLTVHELELIAAALGVSAAQILADAEHTAA